LLLIGACGTTTNTTALSTAADGLNAPAGQASGAATAGTTGVSSRVGVGLSPGAAGGPSAGATGDAGTTGTPGPTLGPTSSAVRNTSPLQIGILDVGDSSAFAAQYGISSSNTYTGQNELRGLAKWFNLHGGIAGRKITIVEYSADPSATTYETVMSAACSKFTQDNHVTVVLSQTAHQVSGNYEACLTKWGVVNIQGSFGGYDRSIYEANPLLFTTSTPNLDRATAAQLRMQRASGWLTPKDKIGVMVESCPYNVAVYERTFAPLAKQLGLDVTRRDFDCVTGNGNIGAAASQVGAAVLPFAAAGINKVAWISNWQGAAAVIFEQAAQSQHYAPSYAVNSLSTAGAFTDQLQASARPRVQGVGWSPDADVSITPPAKGATKRCRDAFTSLGMPPRTTADNFNFAMICSQFFALEAALLANGGRSDAASLARGLETVRSGIPSVIGEVSGLSARRHDVGTYFQVFGYTAACDCFAYEGKPAAG
jgi:hypothetical protein